MELHPTSRDASAAPFFVERAATGRQAATRAGIMGLLWDDYGIIWLYPLGNIQKAIENGPIKIVDLPSYKMVMFHSVLYVY